MKILIWVVLATVQLVFSQVNFLDGANPLALWFHNACFKAIETHPSPWNWFYEAILIGRDEGVRSKPELSSFFVLGLYHLIVVSGSHVLAIEKAIHRFFFFLKEGWQQRLTFLLLVLFCLANRLQASCVRAFISWLVSKNLRLKPTLQGDIQFVVTLLCLIFQPVWAKSLSFQLSCAATLGLAIASSLNWSSVLKALAPPLLCASLTSPLIFSVQPCLSWLILPANVIAMPLFEALLMPLSLLNVALSKVSFVTEKIFLLVFGVADFAAQFQNPLLCVDERRFNQWGLVYLLAVYLFWRFLIPFYYGREFWKMQNDGPPHTS